VNSLSKVAFLKKREGIITFNGAISEWSVFETLESFKVSASLISESLLIELLVFLVGLMKGETIVDWFW
jgi:hypothetical protein